MNIRHFLENYLGIRMPEGAAVRPEFPNGFSSGATTLDSTALAEVKTLVDSDLAAIAATLDNLSATEIGYLDSSAPAEVPTANKAYIANAAAVTSLTKIAAITNGTAAANKALVADANVDIAGLRNLTVTGAFLDPARAQTIAVTGTVRANRLVGHALALPPGNAIEAPGNCLLVRGANTGGEVTDDDATVAAYGPVTLVAGENIGAGMTLKTGYGGTAVHLAAIAGMSVESDNGAEFTNQPATDGVTVVSSDAGDTAVLTITGHTAGTVATEDITLNGTTPVASTKVNWTDILGVEVKTGTLAGTVTVKETSGGLTITTLAPAATSAGVLAAGGSGWGQQLEVVADDASTAYVYVVGLDATDGSALTSIVQLNGATAVALGSGYWHSVTKVYVGAVAAARTVTVQTKAVDVPALCIGRALESVSAGATFAAVLN